MLAKTLAFFDSPKCEAEVIPALRQFFKAYLTDSAVREALESRKIQALYTTASSTMADLRAVPEKYRKLIPEYIKDYVPLNQFVA